MPAQVAGVIPGPLATSWPPIEDSTAAILNALPIALMLTRTDGIITTVNRRAERMFGYVMREMQGKGLSQLVSQRFHARIGQPRPLLTPLTAPQITSGEEVVGQRKDGSEFPVEITVSAIDIGGQPRWLVMLTDLTARRAGERAQVLRQIALERANETLEDFADTVSHDLKAPLRAIALLAEWINDELAPTATPATVESLALLKGRVTRLQVLLDGLLRYARTGHLPGAEVEDLNIGEVVQNIVTMLDMPVGFAVACAGSMPVVRTQRTPIRSVLENLIGNAIRHHDRRNGRITVQARKSGGIAEFRISDDGPGIRPHDHDRIFHMFQTVAGDNSIETSGVGLAIVKKQVHDHGGRIRIESAPPKRGTAFVFTWREGAPCLEEP